MTWLRRIATAFVVLMLLSWLIAPDGVRRALAQAGQIFIAQNGTSTGPTVRGSATTSGLYFGSAFTGIIGHWVVGGATAPTATGCTLTTGSRDTAGTIVTGASAGAICKIVFAAAFAAAPGCTLIGRLATTTSSVPAVYSVSTTEISPTSLSPSTTYDYFCPGRSGG